MSSLRERRIPNEWQMLLHFAQANAAILRVESRVQTSEAENFHVILDGTLAPFLSPAGLTFIDRHEVTLSMPDFFPAVPMQVFLSLPVLHPNVHPTTGFVCVWDRFEAGDSTVETLCQLQRVLSWELFNRDPDHLMQPDALEQYQPERPLAYTALRIPAELRDERTRSPRNCSAFRSRLSALE